jgi:hypothetical protein
MALRNIDDLFEMLPASASIQGPLSIGCPRRSFRSTFKIDEHALRLSNNAAVCASLRHFGRTKSQETTEALGIGYAPKGMIKGNVAILIRLPTGELTGYIGITKAKLPKEFHLSNVVAFPKKTA